MARVLEGRTTVAEHREWKVYDECGHEHKIGDPGVIEVEDIGLVCSEGYGYSVCFACHTDDGDMREDGPWEQAWPCDAAEAQARVKVLESALRDRAIPLLDAMVEDVEDMAEVETLRRALAGRGKP